MMLLVAARKESDNAKRNLIRMEESKNYEEFEEHWRNYLNSIEKIWSKIEAQCNDSTKIPSNFHPWFGQQKSLRRKDMLLRYLKQARNADNHSIQDVAAIQKAHSTINFVKPGLGIINKLVIDNDQIQHYEGDPIAVNHYPEQIITVKVKNNGDWYNPPTSHLGEKIDSQNPLEIAKLGIIFYENLINQAELKLS
ncbi:hypothetical protein [Yersinia bercovieri]|uniref:hypothetical protein n=2 Tax=Yersiniaceae TaxID=1903411 RepID=UPI001C96FD81|nr:hypothetical protein [Yersinia bercovieri]